MSKILVVDDAYFVRMKVRRLLEKYDYVVLEAENGLHAIDVVEREKPDIILLDLVMPVMDGVTALKNIMAINPQSCVILITGFGDQSLFMDAFELGAKDLIQKPLDDKKILDVIKKHS